MEKLPKVALGIAVFAFVVAGFAFFKAPTVLTNTVERIVGSTSSDSSHKWFGDGVTVGGDYLATTTGVTLSSYTLIAQELVNKTVLAINPSVDLTLKIGATSTAQLVPNIGDTAIVYLRNASTTAAATITLAAVDTSTDLQENQGGNLVLAGLDMGTITLIRTALSGTGQVIALWEEGQVAD